MAQPLRVPLPPNLWFGPGSEITVAAINPTTGAIVPNVTVQNVTLEVEPDAGVDTSTLQTGNWLLVPGPGA